MHYLKHASLLMFPNLFLSCVPLEFFMFTPSAPYFKGVAIYLENCQIKFDLLVQSGVIGSK